MRGFLLVLATIAALTPAAAGARPEAAAWPRGIAVVGYESAAAFEAALARHPAAVARRLPRLGVAEVRPHGSVSRFAAEVAAEPGIAFVERLRPRIRAGEPALLPAEPATGPYEWQWASVRADRVPESVQRAAAAITIAVVDTGADLDAPDLTAKMPRTYDVRTRRPEVPDTNGHGTFVASLAAGSVTNGDGIAGFGGDAQLLVIKVGSTEGALTDLDEAAAITYAVERGARVINLSFGGPETSSTERRAIDFAVSRGALIVSAVGNAYDHGNPVEYPAALLQPPGSNGVGGRGLAVGASTATGARASFSTTGGQVSLAAPGDRVFGALSSLSPTHLYPRTALRGAAAGLYGYGSGTSYAAPQVAGAAALVWAANPALPAREVAAILKATAQGGGAWTPELGWGVIDIAAAVARAAATPARAAAARLELATSRSRRRVTLTARLLSAASPAGREIVLERYGGAGWRASARGTTTALGTVTWRYRLSPGRYRLRARFAGSSDLGAAASAPVTLSVS